MKARMARISACESWRTQPLALATTSRGIHFIPELEKEIKVSFMHNLSSKRTSFRAQTLKSTLSGSEGRPTLATHVRSIHWLWNSPRQSKSPSDPVERCNLRVTRAIPATTVHCENALLTPNRFGLHPVGNLLNSSWILVTTRSLVDIRAAFHALIH